jgi:hypothetical protein
MWLWFQCLGHLPQQLLIRRLPAELTYITNNAWHFEKDLYK